MKFMRMLALSLLVAGGGLSTTLTAGQLGGQGEAGLTADGVQTQATDDVYRTGAFHRFDQDHGAVWINDRLYWLHPEFRVIGNATKLGLLSAIRPDEFVQFATVPDPLDARRTLIVEIRRQ